jgi:hypothetical protein
MLKEGGNGKLKQFLKFYNIPRSLPKRQLYGSKILHYYRKSIKAGASNEEFNVEVPGKREMLEAVSGDTSSDYNNYRSEPTNKSISDDHYSSGSNYKSSSDLDNKFITISNNYNNDSRFASISGSPIEKEESSYSNSNSNRYSSTSSDSNTTSGKFFSYLGYAYNVSKDVAWAVKEKVVEMDLPTKLKPVAEKTYEGAKYLGGKMYVAGSEIAKSDTVKSIGNKTYDGVSYLVTRLWKGADAANNQSSSSYGNDNNNSYNQRSSSDYTPPDNYEKFDDNKKDENLLNDRYKY